MNRIISLIFLFFLSLQLLSSQETNGAAILSKGLDDMKNGRMESAIEKFRSIINSKEMKSFYPDALYWGVKADIVLNNFEEASRAAEGFLLYYSDHPFSEEMNYLRGRLYYLQNDPDAAITSLGQFINNYPDSEFLPSALYWVGESLVALGRLEDADAVYSRLLSEYPASIKREAARYRRSEITFLFRERELLDLLKWSHEEYLRDSEDFYRRESSYLKTIEDCKTEIESNKNSLILVKERLLDIKEKYLDDLLELYNAQ